MLLKLKMKDRIIIFILIAFTLGACKKYPEGGLVGTWQGMESKISGQYNIRQLLVNNIDSTSSFIGNPYYCSKQAIIYFSKDQILGATSRTITSYCGTFPENSWKLSGNKKQIEITCINTASTGNLYPLIINENLTITWDIQRLTKHDLYISTNLNGKEYYLNLAQIH